MSFLITTLYTVFLGTLFRNFVIVQLDAASNVVTVSPVIGIKNWARTIPLLLLFMVDWVCFLFLFPPSTSLSFSIQDMTLLVLYVPTLAMLGTCVMLSLECSQRYCFPLGIYHCTAALAEAWWVICYIAKVENIGGKEAALISGLVIFYGLIRLALALFYFAIAKNLFPRLQPAPFTLISVLLKPTIFFFVGKYTQFFLTLKEGL